MRPYTFIFQNKMQLVTYLPTLQLQIRDRCMAYTHWHSLLQRTSSGQLKLNFVRDHGIQVRLERLEAGI